MSPFVNSTTGSKPVSPMRELSRWGFLCRSQPCGTFLHGSLHNPRNWSHNLIIALKVCQTCGHAPWALRRQYPASTHRIREHGWSPRSRSRTAVKQYCRPRMRRLPDADSPHPASGSLPVGSVGFRRLLRGTWTSEWTSWVLGREQYQIVSVNNEGKLLGLFVLSLCAQAEGCSNGNR